MRVWQVCFGGMIILCTSCMEQYNPRPYWEQYKAEREMSNREVPQLNDDGSIPNQDGVDAGKTAVNADASYTTYCVSCHGANGDADTPMAKALNPPPRDFKDAQWQASVDDARIFKVIKEGGASVGLSATMTPWGGMLSDDEIEKMVDKVRSFAK